MILKTFYFMHQSDLMKRKRAKAVLVDFCHTKLGFQEKKYFGHFLRKIKDYSCDQKIQFHYSLVRIVRCRIARTTLDPTVHGFVFIIYIALPWQLNDSQNTVDIDGLHHIHKVDHKIREFKVLGIALLKIKTSSSVTCLSSIQ